MKKVGLIALIVLAVFGVVVAAFFAVLFLYFLPKAAVVKNSSPAMGESCPLNATVVVDKEFYKNKGLSRGDVVVFKRNGEEGYFVKRIMGLSGESIEMTPLGFSVDGRVISEPYLLNHSMPGKNFVKLVLVPPIIENQKIYYLLGDNEPRNLDAEHPDDVVFENQITGYVASCRVIF